MTPPAWHSKAKVGALVPVRRVDEPQDWGDI